MAVDCSKSSLGRVNSELEYLLISSGKIAKYTLKPSDVDRIYRSTRMKAELVNFFQDLYKPKSQFEQEKVEYNQINILAEYQMFNIIFAKNELMFDEFKTAVLLEIFWQLLEFIFSKVVKNYWRKSNI